MSVRPLDIALTVQRTPEVNRNQTNEGIRHEVLGQQSTDTVKKEVQFQDQNVVHTNKSEENNVSRDGKGNGGYGGDSGGKKKKKGNKDEFAEIKHNGILDVSI